MRVSARQTVSLARSAFPLPRFALLFAITRSFCDQLDLAIACVCASSSSASSVDGIHGIVRLAELLLQCVKFRSQNITRFALQASVEDQTPKEEEQEITKKTPENVDARLSPDSPLCARKQREQLSLPRANKAERALEPEKPTVRSTQGSSTTGAAVGLSNSEEVLLPEEHTYTCGAVTYLSGHGICCVLHYGYHSRS